MKIFRILLLHTLSLSSCKELGSGLLVVLGTLAKFTICIPPVPVSIETFFSGYCCKMLFA